MGASASVPQKPPDLGPEYHVPYSKENAPHSVTLITDERPIKYARKGIASEAESPARTVIDIIRGVEKMQCSCASALRVERPCPPLDPVTKKAPPSMDPAKLTTWTYAEYFAEARNLAAALVGLGVQERDTVCIFGFNAPEWHMSALAAVMAHGSFSGIYPSDTPQQIQWKALLTNASVAFVDSNSGADRFIKIVDQLPYLKAVVHWGDEFDKTKGPISRADGSQVQYLHWKDALERGVGHDAEVESRMNAAKPSDCCNLIFTSGTTGKPKAAMLSHDNIIHCCHIASASIRDFINSRDRQQRTLSYLPLSHIAGTVFDIFLPIVSMFDSGAGSETGWEVTMARPYDLKAGSLKDRLVLTRPTIFLGVPRVWEKIHERMLIIGSKVKGAKRKIADWAKSKSLRNAEDAQVGGKGTTPLGYGLASGLLAKIKKALGLDCCRLGFSGAAPLKMATLRYFASIDIQINELYGMSECTGTTTMSTPLTHTWGSVGFPLPGVEIKIFKPSSEADSASDAADKVECPRAQDLFRPLPAEEGEICFRGRHIMLGYLANPSLGEDHVLEMRRKNNEAIDNEGWLHSGDKGCIDTSGMLRVTGRYKELIIGAGGENIAPVPIEDAILEACPAISNVIMIGDKRKFNVALVTLKTEGATGDLPGSDDLAGPALDLVDGITKVSEAIASEAFAKKVTDVFVAVNKNGEVVPSNAAKIQKFMILRQDFSITTGELTATLKLKRNVVEGMYKDLIDSMYESGETYVQCPL